LNNVNCVIYARVSTEQQAERELSIPAQLNAARDYAVRLGWTVLEEFVEPGASARSAQRPALQRLLKHCREEPKVNVVLVHKIDRLARNVHDHAMIRFQLRQHDVKLASVVENIDDSVSGQLVEHIMSSIAEFYSANLSEEVKKGMQAMVQQGGWPHKPTRGYRLVRSEEGKSRVEVDVAAAPVIREAFEIYATGFYSLHDLRQQLAEQGIVTQAGNPMPLEGIRHMLMNAFYAGRVRWNGQDYPGKHEAIVPYALFERVQRVLKRRHTDTGEKGKLRFLLRGVAICGECGSKLTAERHDRWAYYRCIKNSRDKRLCSARFSNVAVAHENLKQLYGTLHLSEDFKRRILETGERMLVARHRDARRNVERIRMTCAKLEAREIQLTEAFAAGEVSRVAYRQVSVSIRQRIVATKATLTEAAQNPKALTDRLRGVLAFADSVKDLHRTLHERERQHLLRILFRHVVLEEGTIVGYRFNPPFDLLFGDPGGASNGPFRPDLELIQVTRSKKMILEVHQEREDLDLHTLQHLIDAVLTFDVVQIAGLSDALRAPAA
jgi:site-specific DNA recombinase